MPRSSTTGRHESGQNFLVDASVIRSIVDLVDATSGPILEIGPGDGALTRPLARLGRPLTAIELDARRAERLDRATPRHVAVRHDDVLRARMPPHPHVVVGNLPFHLTTAILRRLLADPAWTDAVLLVQWEVARRRAGVGGATLLTAQSWPWFDYALHGRVPARAFRPTPGVDGGVLRVTRRRHPLVPVADRRAYESLMTRVFTGPGRGLRDVVRRATGLPDRVVVGWMRRHDLPPTALPRHPRADAWADLWSLARR
jgi:Dimethyladenosine transferase (rRNA methylation)